jgi:plastocyanin
LVLPRGYAQLAPWLVLAFGCQTNASRAEPGAGSGSAAASAPSSAPSTGFDDQLFANLGGATIAGQILDDRGQPAPFVVAYLKDAPKAESTTSAPAVMDQKDKAFLPKVLPILVGTEVTFKNSDRVLHNVYSRAKPKAFDLGAFSSTEAKKVVFDAPGRVDVFCAIHTNMHSVILVLDNPYFATSDARGFFAIANAPTGRHDLVIWDEVRGEHTEKVDVSAERATIVKKTLAKE